MSSPFQIRSRDKKGDLQQNPFQKLSASGRRYVWADDIVFNSESTVDDSWLSLPDFYATMKNHLHHKVEN